MDRMAQTNPPEDLMQYEAMAQDALRGVVKAALKKAAAPGGLPEPHHLYITFKTQAAGVSGPQDLLGKYPDEMTIILQHQYWDLAPGETFFSVTLKFGGQPKRLSVPYWPSQVVKRALISSKLSAQNEASICRPFLKLSGAVGRSLRTALSIIGIDDLRGGA